MNSVPRIGRAFDLAGLLLFVIGASAYVRAWIGFRSMLGDEPTVNDTATNAVAIADGFWRLQKVGAGLMFAGVGVFVLAWWVARRSLASR